MKKNLKIYLIVLGILLFIGGCFIVLKYKDKEYNKIKIQKTESNNYNDFNKYLEQDNIDIYIKSNLKEIFYYIEPNKKVTLKEFITTSSKTIEDSIKNLTNLLELTYTAKDGGTKIYKSEDFDITIIKCNTIEGNKDIFVGDYLMDFDDSKMCKR